jgi:voltage-gated potassium channel
MYDVIKNKRQELLITFSVVGFLIVLSSSIMYFAEHNAQPDKFTSIPGTMYWAVATLTTIGYGDIFPVTNIGRILTSFIAILGVAIFALPAGIFASGFSELSSKNEIPLPLHERLRELNKLKEENILTEEEYTKQKEKILNT